MTPEDKSKELIEKFKPFVNQMCPIHDGSVPCENPEWDEKNNAQMERLAKACSIIAVDEIIEAIPFPNENSTHIDYWMQVKQLLSKE